MSGQLQGDLHATNLPNLTRQAIAHAYWGPTGTLTTASDVEQLGEPYFRYYSQQCSTALLNAGQHVSARTHDDLVKVVRMIRATDDRQSIFGEIERKLKNRNLVVKDQMIEGTIDLAARLYSMSNIGELPNALVGGNVIRWTANSLQSCLAQQFSGQPEASAEPVRFEKIFNAHNLTRVAGLRIKWISDLNDHLRMTDDDRTVAIFHHASFLRLHRNTGLYPPGLIEETLRTLALLFPQTDQSTRRWVKLLPTNIDKRVRCCGHLRSIDRHSQNFSYWKDRLVLLKEVFDEAEPRSLSQWWFDRRKRVQWYTFWVAIMVLLLTIFFGIVQSIEGALQVYKAYHPAS